MSVLPMLEVLHVAPLKLYTVPNDPSAQQLLVELHDTGPRYELGVVVVQVLPSHW